MKHIRWITAAKLLSLTTPALLLLARLRQRTKRDKTGLTQDETEQEMAAAILPALMECRALDADARQTYITALIECQVVPGANAKHAEPGNFEALLELVTAKASSANTSTT